VQISNRFALNPSLPVSIMANFVQAISTFSGQGVNSYKSSADSVSHVARSRVLLVFRHSAHRYRFYHRTRPTVLVSGQSGPTLPRSLNHEKRLGRHLPGLRKMAISLGWNTAAFLLIAQAVMGGRRASIPCLVEFISQSCDSSDYGHQLRSGMLSITRPATV
jgi:hypothetical protein